MPLVRDVAVKENVGLISGQEKQRAQVPAPYTVTFGTPGRRGRSLAAAAQLKR